MSEDELSPHGRRIVDALNEFLADLETGQPLPAKYNVRLVRVIPSPSAYSPEDVRMVRKLLDATEEEFARMMAVRPLTVRLWERGERKPSTIARRFLDEIRMSPDHFRGRIIGPKTRVVRKSTSKISQETPGSTV